MVINEEYLASLILMTDYLDQVLESLDYLARRTALTKDTYLLVMFSYEEKHVNQRSKVVLKTIYFVFWVIFIKNDY